MSECKFKRAVPFMNLAVTDSVEMDRLMAAFGKVLKHGRMINGPELQEFEAKISEYCGRQFAVGVNSGTDAIYMGLKALGIGAGDEVITTSFSWIASANAIVMTGAEPVFADIREDLNIDPESIEKLISEKTRAIMPVHYSGKLCDVDEIRRIADKYGVLMVEDAAQAIGAKYRGKRAGSFGDLVCASLNPMKLLSACGEAGVILTDNEEVYQKLITLRYNGMINKEVCEVPGLNGRMDTLQAAVLIERLELLDKKIDKRNRNAELYNRLLTDEVGKPSVQEGYTDIYFNYIINAGDERDQLALYLESSGIETKKRDYDCLPFQPAYRDTYGEYERAKKIASKLLCLPVFEGLNEEDIKYIAATVNEFYGSKLND